MTRPADPLSIWVVDVSGRVALPGELRWTNANVRRGKRNIPSFGCAQYVPIPENSMTNDTSDSSNRPRIDWSDPNVPVGDAPSVPRWPLVGAAVAWLSWVAFLITMVIARAASTTF